MSRHWNYRVLEFSTPDGESWRAIHEVYYDEDGKPGSYSSEPAVVLWDLDDGSDGPGWILDRMQEALGKPALKASDFPNPEAEPG